MGKNSTLTTRSNTQIMIKNRLQFAVIGDPVAHSLSPVMHNAAFAATGKNAEYTAINVKAEHIDDFFTEARKKLAGFNVTVPHKGAACRNAEILSDAARLSGSANTVKISEDGTVYADTTDGCGFERAVAEAFEMPLAGQDICILGCGGVVQALVWHCAIAGVRSIRILNRSLAKAEILTAQLKQNFPNLICGCGELSDRKCCAEFLEQSGLAVQCTSLGLHADDPAPADPALFPKNIRYFDTIYKQTALLTALEDRGIRTQNGLSMLLHQGAKSYEIWFGESAPVEVMRSALLKAIQNR